MDSMTYMFYCYTTTQDEAIFKIRRLAWFLSVYSNKRQVFPELFQ